MQELRAKVCAICGEVSSASHAGFLVAENSWEDKLIILQWNDPMASRDGIQVACCADHVEELVVRWMTTGSLEYPLARTALGERASRAMGCSARIDISGGRQLGELAVHRESLERVLAENPQSLRVILDALLEALRQESPDGFAPVPLREEKLDTEEEDDLCAVASDPEP
jgi:hypothetical protein